uniref:Uncharacterized protein n=1 Tax=Heterorhabditis bacteriophora TaxID=37862 RepID=A0A1I7W7S9_HETBA
MVLVVLARNFYKMLLRNGFL